VSQTLNRSEWKNVLDQLTADHEGQHVTIELLDPSVGHQYEAGSRHFLTSTLTPRTT
jgi:hypothetical protein